MTTKPKPGQAWRASWTRSDQDRRTCETCGHRQRAGRLSCVQCGAEFVTAARERLTVRDLVRIAAFEG